MKFKKLMLVMLVLLAVLTIGAVSASDNADFNETLTADNVDEVSVDASVVDEISSDEDSPALSNDGYEITFHEDGEYDLSDDETRVVDIAVPDSESANGNVVVTVQDEEWNLDIPIGELDFDMDDEVYYLVPDSFQLDEGTYNVTVAYYENEVPLATQSGTLTFIGSEDEDLFVYIWEEDDEKGPLYLDAEDCVVSVDVMDGSEGIISIIVNGDKENQFTWEIECEPWEDFPYRQWSLEDLGIEEEGNYTIEVQLNWETIKTGALNVTVWDENSYRVIKDYEDDQVKFLLYCPDGAAGTVYVKIETDDEGDRILIWNNTFEITPEYYGEYMEFAPQEYVEDEGDYHITITVNDDDFTYGDWFYVEESSGEEIEVSFGNPDVLINDDMILIIKKEDYPDDADDDFIVIISDGDDDYENPLNKAAFIDDGENYVLTIGALANLPEIGEASGFDIKIQFYIDGENAYFAEDEIEIYTSPYIVDEAYLLMNDVVISFRPLPGQDDEFKVIISKDGADDIIKTFKLNDFIDNDEEFGPEEVPLYDICLSDLGIGEEGEYHISVNFTSNGKELAFNEMDVAVGLVEIRYWEPDEDETELNDVFDSVVTIRVTEDVEGMVRIYVNGTQVGGDIPLSDLYYNDWPSDRGRQILLNDLNIGESGVYPIKFELYDGQGAQITDKLFVITVEIGDREVYFYDSTFGAEIYDVIEFKIGSPIPKDSYYVISLNGKKAGNYTLGKGIVISDEFTVPFFDVNLLTPGEYQVNVNYFDGEKENDFANGSFSISSLNATCDKMAYVVGDKVIISFNAPDPKTTNYRLDAYQVYFAGPAGWDEDMMFNPYFSEDIIRDGLWKDGVITFEFDRFDEDGTYYIHITNRINPDDEEDEIIGDVIVIRVASADPALTISVADITEGSNAIVSITTNKTFSGIVSVQIGTGNYTVEVINGTGTLPVSGLSAGTYTAVATFSATSVFHESTKNATFNVKAITSIKAAAVTTTYGTSKNLVVTLTDAKGNALVGKSVTIVLNGVKTILTTNAKGQAILAVPNKLAVKKYDATFTFDGDAGYAKSTGTVKVTVNKAKSKLSAKKSKTFKKSSKSKKAKRYVVALKTDKNKAMKKVKVTLKLTSKKKKKTITVKTNNKGKATFDLSKLAKGKYKAVVSFKGNSYYKAVTKKGIKITVKK